MAFANRSLYDSVDLAINGLVTTIESGIKTTHADDQYPRRADIAMHLSAPCIVVTKPPPKWLRNHFKSHPTETRPSAGFLASGDPK